MIDDRIGTSREVTQTKQKGRIDWPRRRQAVEKKRATNLTSPAEGCDKDGHLSDMQLWNHGNDFKRKITRPTLIDPTLKRRLPKSLSEVSSTGVGCCRIYRYSR